MTRYTAENTTHIGKPCTVFLNGKEMPYVIEADDKLGFAIIVDQETGDQSLLTGDVKVTFT